MKRYLILAGLIITVALMLGMKTPAMVADYIYSDSGTVEVMDTSTFSAAATFNSSMETDVIHVADSTPISVSDANSGKVHLIPNLSADTTFNLPSEADLQHYKFVYKGGSEDAKDWLIDTGSDTNYFVGGLNGVDPDDGSLNQVYSDGDSNSKMTILTPGAGTVVELWCDGTNWYVSGQVISSTDTPVTFGDQ